MARGTSRTGIRWILLAAGVTCFVMSGARADAQTTVSYMYWSEFASNGDVMRKNLESGDVESILADQGLLPAIAVDLVGEYVYWGNRSTFEVWRCNLDGTDPVLLASTAAAPTDVYVDAAGGHVYIAMSKAVVRVDLDGNNLEDVVACCGSANSIIGMTVDPVGGKVYFNDNQNQPGTEDRVFRTDMDGTGLIETLYPIPGPNNSVGGKLVIDPAAGKLYQAVGASPAAGTVMRSDLDGSNIEIVIPNTGGDASYGLAVSIDHATGTLYWSNLASEIWSADLDGGNPVQVGSPINRPEGIAHANVPCVAGGSVCQEDLGFQGPGSITMSICGEDLTLPCSSATLSITGAAPDAQVFLPVGFVNDPTPVKGGMLVPLPWVLLIDTLSTDGAGNLSLPVPGGLGPFTLYLQAVVLNGPVFEFSNALKMIQ